MRGVSVCRLQWGNSPLARALIPVGISDMGITTMSALEILLCEIDELEGQSIAATLVGITPERADSLKTVTPSEWEEAYGGCETLAWCQELSKSLMLDGPKRLDGLTLPDGTTLKLVSAANTGGHGLSILEFIPASTEELA